MIMTINNSMKFLTALCVFAMLLPLTSWAGPGHDHGEDAPAVAGDGPRRMPTGEVFLPKPAQRQLNVRTMPALLERHAKVIELNGKVVLDPQTGGVVQTTTGGRFEAAAGGVPQLGKSVKKGELLGYVVASEAPLERSGQQAQLAQVKAQLALAQSRLQRVQQLQDTIPKKEIDAAASEVQSLKGQMAALAGGIGAKEALRAPTSGVIASSNAVSGKVFEAGDLLFEVVNPGVVRIDASWFDTGTPPEFSGANVVSTMTSNEQSIALNYLGAAGAVRDQSLTLAFENRELGNVQFATGQLLKVYAEQAQKVEGIAVASSALVKNAANQTAVWVKVAPETFEPRVITFEPLDGQRVLVNSGLKPFDRVVVQAASLINQVR
jgi:membrane fusion protein, heavy metal efflux system